jgi:hypothetical protein
LAVSCRTVETIPDDEARLGKSSVDFTSQLVELRLQRHEPRVIVLGDHRGKRVVRPIHPNQCDLRGDERVTFTAHIGASGICGADERAVDLRRNQSMKPGEDLERRWARSARALSGSAAHNENFVPVGGPHNGPVLDDDEAESNAQA